MGKKEEPDHIVDTTYTILRVSSSAAYLDITRVCTVNFSPLISIASTRLELMLTGR